MNRPLLALSIGNLLDLEKTCKRYRELGARDETPILVNGEFTKTPRIILEITDTNETLIDIYQEH